MSVQRRPGRKGRAMPMPTEQLDVSGIEAFSQLSFDDLPREARVRAFGVDYAHLKSVDGGDFYFTRFG